MFCVMSSFIILMRSQFVLWMVIEIRSFGLDSIENILDFFNFPHVLLLYFSLKIVSFIDFVWRIPYSSSPFLLM